MDLEIALKIAGTGMSGLGSILLEGLLWSVAEQQHPSVMLDFYRGW